MAIEENLNHCAFCSKKNSSLFCNAKSQHIDEVNEKKINSVFKKGQLIFNEGGYSHGLFCINSGKIKLSQRGDELKDAYMDPREQEIVSLGMRIPLMDWGLGRGRFKMAQSAQEVVKANVQQAEVDFQQEVILEVMQFNLQNKQLTIAAKADTIGQNRFNVSKQRFLIGRISVLDLNVAQTEKDVAARGYLSALRNYWNYYYKLRSLTLYDWLKKDYLGEDFEELLK